MNDILSNSSQRLHEVNTLLAACKQGSLSFEQALRLSLSYRDFNGINNLVRKVGNMAQENPTQLLDFSISPLSEADKYLPLDKSDPYAANFERIFEEYLKPFEPQHKEAEALRLSSGATIR